MQTGLRKCMNSWKGGLDRIGEKQVDYGLPCISSRQQLSSKTGLFANPNQSNKSQFSSDNQVSQLRSTRKPGKTIYCPQSEKSNSPSPKKRAPPRVLPPADNLLSGSPFSHHRFQSLMTGKGRDVYNSRHALRELEQKTLMGFGDKRIGKNRKYQVQYGSVLANGGVRKNPSFLLSDFEIIERIGIGYFGSVSLAKWKTNFNKPCVLKCVAKRHAQAADQVAHLRNEKEFLKSLRHPFIVRGYGTFQDAENIYFVMEYIPGGELYSVVRKELKSQLDGILFYLTEIAIALEFLHEKRIAYRDLKPENILVDDHGHVKLIDLGFAKKITNNRTASLCGTPGYLAPEQISRQEYGKEVDIWAFGVLMFELLAGYNPFFDRDPRQFLANVNSGIINWPSYMPRAAIDFLKKLLITDPAARLPFSEFKTQPLFKNWDQIQQKQTIPPAIPTLTGSFDTKYFGKDLSKIPQTHKETEMPDLSSDIFKDFQHYYFLH